MPKDNKKRAASSSDSDSGPEDRGPAAKKPTPAASKSRAEVEDEFNLDLGRKRTVKISEFKGKRYIDIREYYEDKSTKELKPGKKGITLYLDEFNRLVEAADDIRKAMRS